MICKVSLHFKMPLVHCHFASQRTLVGSKYICIEWNPTVLPFLHNNLGEGSLPTPQSSSSHFYLRCKLPIILGIGTWLGQVVETAIRNKQIKAKTLCYEILFITPYCPTSYLLGKKELGGKGRKEYFPIFPSFIFSKEYCAHIGNHCHQRKEWYCLEFNTQDSLQAGINYKLYLLLLW